MLDNNSIARLLYCDEDPLVSSTTPPPPPPPSAASSNSCSVVVAAPQQQQQQAVVVGDHVKELLEDHMARQRFYAPSTCCRADYLEHLLMDGGSSVSCARSRGVHYIIYAFGRLGLTVGTLFNAVNYLDRFLSINYHLCWEAWMVELVSVACLSIACKLDEVNIPSFHHLQMEEVMSHSFLPTTVRDMELTLLKALQWRLACVTPYSFLQLLLLLPAAVSSSSLTPPRTTTTRLLIRSLTEPSFIHFDSSLIAFSALRCCVALLEEEEDRRHHTPPPVQDHGEAADEYSRCFRMMETLLYASCCCCSESSDSNYRRPCLELMMETAAGAGGGGGSGLTNNSRPSAVTRRRLMFGASSSAPASASAPQGSSRQLLLQDNDDDDNTHVRDEDISHT